VDFHDGERVYPYVPAIGGMALGTFTIPGMGEAAGSRWYRIHLQVRDSHGHTHAVFRDVYAQEMESDELAPARIR
jgi:hypothetical protein